MAKNQIVGRKDPEMDKATRFWADAKSRERLIRVVSDFSRAVERARSPSGSPCCDCPRHRLMNA